MEAERVSEYWARPPDPRIVGWQSHPRIKRWINTRISGDPSAGMMKYFRDRWFKTPAASALSIGCGFGNFEREAVRHGIVSRIEGVDISEGAIAACRRDAAAFDQISYQVADCNTMSLPTTAYDAVFGMGSIHHVSALEHLYREVARSLKPGGLFCMNEYIGPTRFRASPLVQRYINGLLQLLPPEQRRYVRNPENVKVKWEPPSPLWFEKNDPSEAVRSGDIVPFLSEYFDILDMKPFGGAILHHLLAGIAGNLHESEPEDCAYLDMLMDAEQRLERVGLVSSDFAVIVCRPKV